MMMRFHIFAGVPIAVFVIAACGVVGWAVYNVGEGEPAPASNAPPAAVTGITRSFNLDEFDAVDITYRGRILHLTREQLGHYAKILQGTFDPEVPDSKPLSGVR